MNTTIGRAAVEPGTVIVHGSAAGFAQEIAAGRHPLKADEPISVGGTDTGPTRTTSFSQRSDPARR